MVPQELLPELYDRGEVISKNSVATSMWDLAIVGISPRSFKVKTTTADLKACYPSDLSPTWLWQGKNQHGLDIGYHIPASWRRICLSMRYSWRALGKSTWIFCWSPYEDKPRFRGTPAGNLPQGRWYPRRNFSYRSRKSIYRSSRNGTLWTEWDTQINGQNLDLATTMQQLNRSGRSSNTSTSTAMYLEICPNWGMESRATWTSITIKGDTRRSVTSHRLVMN